MGYVPERTLVLETISPVDRIQRALSKIPGFEVLEDLIGDEVEPDEDFYESEGGQTTKNPLKSYLYLTVSNQAALQEIIRHWNGSRKNPHYDFPRGLAPLKHLFKQLHAIRFWDVEDRIRTTGIVDDWKFREAAGEDVVPVEIELHFRENRVAQQASADRILRNVAKAGGNVVTQCVIPEIRYHAILARIPIGSTKSILESQQEHIDLFRCDDVMFFRPSGRVMAPPSFGDADSVAEEAPKANEEINTTPVVALLDGLPLEHHHWIADYVDIDDPDDFRQHYSSAQQQMHGTAMASLLVRGDYQHGHETTARRIYCRPITIPYPTKNGFHERIPAELLPIDLVHRAVIRMLKGGGGEKPVAPSIKIINLSVADPDRLFERAMSPWAKLIDYLSFEYQVLFVISAGNHTIDIPLPMKNHEFEKLSVEQAQKVIFEAVTKEQHAERRLMSPGEAINALTIGAYHDDGGNEEKFQNIVNPYQSRHLPSPVNTAAWGKKRSMKPEVLMPGGRVKYQLRSMLNNDPAVLRLVNYISPPGSQVAYPGAQGNLHSFAFIAGTSIACALASRRLQFLYETLQDLYSAEHGAALSRKNEAVLLKALFCHGASVEKTFPFAHAALSTTIKAQQIKAHAARILGYGIVDEERIHGCKDNQATIVQAGVIGTDESQTFQFVLPDCLAATTIKRRLIITLAWFSPVNPANQAYRQASLFFETAVGEKAENHLGLEDRESEWQMVRNGTVQHEVFTGEQARAYIQGKIMEIKINCKAKAGGKNLRIPYGLVVTLDSPDVTLPIYEQVKQGINKLFAPPVHSPTLVK